MSYYYFEVRVPKLPDTGILRWSQLITEAIQKFTGQSVIVRRIG